MTQRANQPALSPQFCFSPRTLRGFLRLSRSSIDDSIAQNLNALVTPSESGFDAQSTSQPARLLPREISRETCQSFKDRVLFPAWQARTDVLNYCALVSASPDPDDPDLAIREAENERHREQDVDERLDPYSDRFFPREARTQTLAMLIRQERGIEDVVRGQTWDAIQQRCATQSESWQDSIGRWRLRRNA